MSYRRKKLINKKELTFYSIITLVCASIAVVLALISETTPVLFDKLENSMLRGAAEQALGEKIDDATFNELKTKYESLDDKKAFEKKLEKASYSDFKKRNSSFDDKNLLGRKLDEASFSDLKERYKSYTDK